MMGRLPSGFQELSYIRSTGKQWIDGLLNGAPSYSHIKISVTVTPANTMAQFPFNGVYFDQGRIRKWANQSNLGDFQSSFAAGVPYALILNANGTSYELSINGTNYIVPNALTLRFFDSIFRNAAYSAGSYIWSGYFQEYLLYLDDMLFRDLVPCCRLSDNATGMFDLVSQSFFGNSGTGEFIAGVPVLDPIIPTWGSGLAQVSQKELLARRQVLYHLNDTIPIWDFLKDGCTAQKISSNGTIADAPRVSISQSQIRINPNSWNQCRVLSDFIAIPKSVASTYFVEYFPSEYGNYNTGVDAIEVSFYDENKQFIGQKSYTNTGQKKVLQKMQFVVTQDQNANYMRVQFGNGTAYNVGYTYTSLRVLRKTAFP